jgi:hypothetical protein
MRAQEIYEKIEKSNIETYGKHFPSAGSITDILDLRTRLNVCVAFQALMLN